MPGGGTDGAVEPGRAQAVEEAAVHAGAVQQAHGAGVAVGQHRLRSELIGDRHEFSGDRVQRFVPGDAGEPAVAFCADALLRIEQTVRRILAVQVSGHFAAEKAASDGVIGSPRNRLPLPSSTLMSREQQSGQSRAQTDWRTSGMYQIIAFATRAGGTAQSRAGCHPAAQSGKAPTNPSNPAFSFAEAVR